MQQQLAVELGVCGSIVISAFLSLNIEMNTHFDSRFSEVIVQPAFGDCEMLSPAIARMRLSHN